MASLTKRGNKSRAAKSPEQKQQEREEADEQVWKKIQPAMKRRCSVSSMAQEFHVCRVRLSRIIKARDPKYIGVARDRIVKLEVAAKVAEATGEAKKKYPRASECIVRECRKVFIQQHAGHRMCRGCRATNRGWH